MYTITVIKESSYKDNKNNKNQKKRQLLSQAPANLKIQLKFFISYIKYSKWLWLVLVFSI